MSTSARISQETPSGTRLWRLGAPVFVILLRHLFPWEAGGRCPCLVPPRPCWAEA